MDRRGEGWVVFAAVVLGTAGIMRIFDAIWAFSYHGALPQNLRPGRSETAMHQGD